MPPIKLSPDFEAFVQEQIERGRFQSAIERLADVRQKIDEALSDPRPSIPAEDVFARLERKHAAWPMLD